MRSRRAARRFIWVALAVQFAGLAYDAVWHGLIRPGVEPATRSVRCCPRSARPGTR